jgi:prepilin-type processing-associated H-X9-DG protein
MKQLVAAVIALGLTSAAFAQPTGKSSPLPPDLAAVPNDAFAFGHIRLADFWKNDALKDVRGILQKAGPRALEAFDKRFSPAPSTIERLTVYLPTPNFDAGRPEFDFVFIVGVSQPYDREKFTKQLGKTTTHKGRNGDFVVDEEESVAVRFVDDRTLALGSVQAIQLMVDTAPPKKAGPLTPAIELAASGRPVVVGANFSALPPEAIDELTRQMPEPLHPLAKAQALTLSLDFVGDGRIHAQVAYPDVASAQAAEGAVETATTMAKGLIADARRELSDKVFGNGKASRVEDLPEAAASVLGLGALQHAEDLLDKKPVRRTDNTLAMTVALPPHFKSALGTAAVAGSMFAPAVGRLKDAAGRAQSANNLKQIGIALHSFHDVNNALPAAAVVDKKGKPLLSWRVMILPYIEQDELFKQFNLDEPWDSENNKKLIDKMPKTYALPNKLSKPGETHYRVLVGGGSMWDWVQGTTLAQVTDGLSNTWMVVEAEEGVPWTKPDELEFDPKKPLPKFGTKFKGGFNVLYGDGSVRFYRTVPKAAAAMITKAGGEIFTDE